MTKTLLSVDMGKFYFASQQQNKPILTILNLNQSFVITSINFQKIYLL